MSWVALGLMAGGLSTLVLVWIVFQLEKRIDELKRRMEDE
jgi:hypothetical protein